MSTCIHQRVKTCKLLLDRGADVNVRYGQIAYTPLHYAVYHKNMNIAKLVLSADARLDLENREGFTPLAMARVRGHKELVSLIEDHSVTLTLSGVISRGLIKKNGFSDFLIHKIDDPRLFIIVSQFAYN